jgi:hypothetical protein
VRVLFVVGTIVTGGLGLLGYIVLVILMPLPGQPAPFVKNAAVSTTTVDATGEPVATKPVVPEDPAVTERRRAAFGVILIALGAIFLVGSTGVFRLVRWDLVWPLVFIAIGALLLVQRTQR